MNRKKSVAATRRDPLIGDGLGARHSDFSLEQPRRRRLVRAGNSVGVPKERLRIGPMLRPAGSHQSHVPLPALDPLATSGGRECCVWDCAGAGPEGREPVMLPHDAPICAVSFQNSHGTLATASVDGSVRLWSVDRRTPLRATVKMPAPATKLAWSPDDRQLAIGSEKGAVYVLKCEA